MNGSERGVIGSCGSAERGVIFREVVTEMVESRRFSRLPPRNQAFGTFGGTRIYRYLGHVITMGSDLSFEGWWMTGSRCCPSITNQTWIGIAKRLQEMS